MNYLDIAKRAGQRTAELANRHRGKYDRLSASEIFEEGPKEYMAELMKTHAIVPRSVSYEPLFALMVTKVEVKP